MHTFFINTSGKTLDGYDVLFDIHYENRTLVSIDCPMSEWYDREKGYQGCVAKMSDLIDGYVELNNAFNLIIYIDLAENKTYASIRRDDYGDRERDACLRAMHPLFAHAVYGSIVQELEASGRRPQNVLIMFGEDKKYADYRAAEAKASQPEVKAMLFRFLGLPGQDKLEALVKAADDGGEVTREKLESFKKKVLAECGVELIPGLRESYQADLDFWLMEMLQDAEVVRPSEALYERIMSTKRAEEERKRVETVPCPYDCYACSVNKASLARSRMDIALFLLRCVEAGSIYQNGASVSDHDKKLFPFRNYAIEELAPLFGQKASAYAQKAEDIEEMVQTYWEMGLARRLKELNHRKFGLDEYGEKKVDLLVVDAPDEADGKSSEGDAQASEPVPIVKKKKQVVAVRKQGRPLLRDFKPFEFPSDSERTRMVKKNTSATEYVEQAKQIRTEHLDFLNRLKMHIAKTLSNYAGKSKENAPSVLRLGLGQYAGTKDETRRVEEMETVSEKAYDTILGEFLEFCAGRSVAVTDIEEQCDWFVSRIHQITESLNRIKYVALGVLVAIIALYIPFVVIQFEAILESALTVFMAVASFAVPFVMLYLIFGIVAAAQRKKYRQAWLEFAEKADQARLANETAARKYDQFLSTIIPALRWIYEYRLDVGYCADCCEIADAKLEHHRRKLRSRAEAIRNILSDLEAPRYDEARPEGRKKIVSNEIDYNVAFCTGDQNKKYYAVVDKKFFAPADQ